MEAQSSSVVGSGPQDLREGENNRRRLAGINFFDDVSCVLSIKLRVNVERER